MLLVTFAQLTSAPFLSVQYWGITALKGGWILGDIPLCLTFLPIMLRHLDTFLLIVANSRGSTLMTPMVT